MTNQLYLVSAVTALLSACAATTHPVAEPPRRSLDASTCALDAYAPATVRPHHDEVAVQKATLHPLRGADVFIAARPGLTAEWLRHQLQPRTGAAGCALDVAHAEITVASDGPGFLVTIRGRDEATGREILGLARVLEAGTVAAR
jgi:hypothetical protein